MRKDALSSRWLLLPLFLTLAGSAGGQDHPLSPAAEQWWADLRFIASDANQGRQTG